uniref:Small ribosomal subunit protein bS16m n=1 Tax=Oncorhynchus tshawytscha TaxID=74940 RepID=A0AAZ3QWG4_ONCTS
MVHLCKYDQISNRPFYRIVAAYNKRARDSKYIEQLGSYDPLPNIYNEKLVSINSGRIKYWMGCGAHSTKPVAKLLGWLDVLPNSLKQRWRRLMAEKLTLNSLATALVDRDAIRGGAANGFLHASRRKKQTSFW